MRIDQASDSARSASRAAFCAASRALLARMSAPMMRPPQITPRDLVLMARDYSASAPDSQSTTNSWPAPFGRCWLVKPLAEKMLQRLEPLGW